MTASFKLDGQAFTALNGGPAFTFTPAVSFVVHCETQDEVDEYWRKLSEGGEPGRCGWLKDKYGLSWQIVPRALTRLLESGNAEQSKRVVQALMQMDKLDIARLQQAYASA